MNANKPFFIGKYRDSQLASKDAFCIPIRMPIIILTNSEINL